MSKKEKLIQRVLSQPTDFTFEELITLLRGLGYILDEKGKTGGSRIAFYHKETQKVILMHRPHPDNYIKQYMIRSLIDTLKGYGDL